MKEQNFKDIFSDDRAAKPGSASRPELTDGSRVAVLGGGPAGSFFTYFLLDMVKRAGFSVEVDIYEKRVFTTPGPVGCNMCGGIISESLVQTLAAEGIILPPTIVERGIDSYILHMDVGSTRIDTPLQEKRIAAVHRGAGPMGIKEMKWGSFDAYLLGLATEKGANHIHGHVDEITLVDGRPNLKTKGGELKAYDMLAVCVGVNSATLKLFDGLPIEYTPPKTTKTWISEFFLGQEVVEKYLGSSMHVFLLNIPRVEFAALIPKGDYATFCLLGEEIDEPLVRAMLDTPEVKRCMPPGWTMPKTFCHCGPRINVGKSPKPYADRIVFIGDCGATRLYKDGIGAAYRTGKSAATTAAFVGVSAKDFEKHFMPVCNAIERDNAYGKFIFQFTRLIQKMKTDRKGVLEMVLREQASRDVPKRMSMVLWDTFTGSAPYKDILLRTMQPGFLANFARHIVSGGIFSRSNGSAEPDVQALIRGPMAEAPVEPGRE